MRSLFRYGLFGTVGGGLGTLAGLIPNFGCHDSQAMKLEASYLTLNGCLEGIGFRYPSSGFACGPLDRIPSGNCPEALFNAGWNIYKSNVSSHEFNPWWMLGFGIAGILIALGLAYATRNKSPGVLNVEEGKNLTGETPVASYGAVAQV